MSNITLYFFVCFLVYDLSMKLRETHARLLCSHTSCNEQHMTFQTLRGLMFPMKDPFVIHNFY